MAPVIFSHLQVKILAHVLNQLDPHDLTEMLETVDEAETIEIWSGLAKKLSLKSTPSNGAAAPKQVPSSKKAVTNGVNMEDGETDEESDEGPVSKKQQPEIRIKASRRGGRGG